MDRSSEVACTVLANTIEKLKEQDVKLEACILKIQMIMPGSEATKASSEDIAARTIDVLSWQVAPSTSLFPSAKYSITWPGFIAKLVTNSWPNHYLIILGPRL